MNAYSFGNKVVKFVYDYLTSRKQGTRIFDTYSLWQENIKHAIYICNLLFIVEDCDIANYADDNTPYLIGKNIEVLNGLENVSANLFQYNSLLKTS